MQVWNVLHAARWNTGRKKSPKIRHLSTIAQLCGAASSQLKHAWTIGINVKQQYLLHTFSKYGELRPNNGWDRFGSSGHPSKFQRVSTLGFVTAPTSLNGGQPNFARCLDVSWARTLYIRFCGLLPLTEIRQVQNSLCVQVLRCLTLERYCTVLEQLASAKLCGVRQRAPPIFGRSAITLGIGPHSTPHLKKRATFGLL